MENESEYDREWELERKQVAVAFQSMLEKFNTVSNKDVWIPIIRYNILIGIRKVLRHNNTVHFNSASDNVFIDKYFSKRITTASLFPNSHIKEEINYHLRLINQ